MKIVWTPEARADLRAIRDYLSPKSPRAARRILRRIITRVRTQADMPWAAPIEREGPERCLVVMRTPYILLYTVSENALTVVAIYHAMQER